MNKKVLLPFLIVDAIVLLIVAYFMLPPSMDESDHNDTDHHDSEDDVHYHAGFRVVVNGEVQDYSGIEYMRISPCSTEYDTHRPVDLTNPKERIHLHNNIGTVAHIHAAGVVWRELFVSLGLESLLSLPVTITNDKGQRITDGLTSIISPYESVLFSFGTSSLSKEDMAPLFVTQEDILTAEAQVEACGS